uniref:Serine-threonine/tyrosine-protein kinase catalytic domain-containing protein n=1 Tax=Zea mays TaxID=4577 RepID=A0A804LY84_MAIZE
MNGSKCDRCKWRPWRWLVASWVLAVILERGGAEVTELDLEERRNERRDLLVLRDTLRSALDLHSNWTGPPCHGERSRWHGVSCDGDGRVVGVSLDGAQLTGTLPGLDGLSRLRAVDLSSNRFSGPIPRGYATSLWELARLELQDNLLNGTLPAFEQHGLVVFNVSYNFLQGEVPGTRALRRFPASAFDHNLRLCGEVVNADCRDQEGLPSSGAPAYGSSSPVVRPAGDGGRAARKHLRFRLAAWSVVAICLIAALVPFAAVFIFLHHKKKSQEVRLGGRASGSATVTAAEDIKDKVEVEQGRGSGSRSTESGKGAELQLFRADGASFDLDELFRSTAEMLGKGRLGITYRVALQAGPVVVVKRLRNMSHVPRRDFTHTMQLLGKLRHENVVDLVACFYSKEEKLVVYEHVPGCSLFQLLHGTSSGTLACVRASRPCRVGGDNQHERALLCLRVRRKQRRGEDAAAVAGAAVGSAGHGAWAGVPAQVPAVLPPAAARQPQVVQCARLLLGSQRQAAEAGGAKADGPRLPPAAPAPRAPAGGGQVPRVRAPRRQAAVVPRRRVLPRVGAAGAGDGEGARGGRRRPGGVGAGGAQPRVVHGHPRRGDPGRPGAARGHAPAHGGRSPLRRRRARQAAQAAGRHQDDRRYRRRRRIRAGSPLS